MIAFVIITTILNLGLGYALAVYLGRANSSALANEPSLSTVSSPFAFQQASPTLPGSVFSQGSGGPLQWPTPQPPAEQPSLGYAGMGEPTANAVAAGVVRAESADPRDAEQPVRNNAAEQDLLAGIEEFRNQLAQLKGQGVPVGA